MHVSILLLLLFSSRVLADGTPMMKMHVFETAQVETTYVDPVEPDMKMHMFVDEPPKFNESAVVRPQTSADSGFNLDVQAGTGYQHDALSWSVAAPSGTPDTLTATGWKQNMWGLNGEVLLSSPWDVVLKGSGGYAWTFDGTGTETSYLNDGQTHPFSSVQSNANGSTAWEASVAIGYAFKFAEADPVAQFNLTPLAGYMWQEQSLQLKNGVQTIPVQGAIDSFLTNFYVARWDGPWVGFDTDVLLFEHHQIFSAFSYHWADYTAQGQWQQNSALQHPVSFKHQANAHGYLASLGYRYIASDLWSAHLAFDYQNWASAQGEEQLYLNSGTQINSQLNKVQRESFAVNAGVRLSF